MTAKIIRLTLITCIILPLQPSWGEIGIPSANVVDGGLAPTGMNLGMTMDDVRCRAAAESSVAKSLLGEIRSLRCSKKFDDEARQCAERVLHCLAVHARNQDAADAMIAAYRLVSIEERSRHLVATAQRVQKWRAAIDKLLETGVAKPDDSELQKQQDTFPDAEIRLKRNRDKLNLQLTSLLNLNHTHAAELVVEETLDVHVGIVDVQQATACALQHRADLKAIQALCPCITADNLASAKQFMAILQPGVGLELKSSRNIFTKCFTKKQDAEREATERRKQCCSMVESRQRQIRTEVLAASIVLEEAYARLSTAEQLAITCRQRITQRRKSAELDLVSGATVIRAELEAFAAEDALLQRKLEAREEEIRWTRVQGRMLEGCCPL
jgi:hypothetical protein